MRIDISFATWIASLVAGGAIVPALVVGGALLLRTEGSRLANRSLGALLLVAALAVLYALLLLVQPPGENLGVVLAPLPYTLALGPLLYTYVRARLGRGRPGWGHAVLPLAQAVVVLTVGLGPLAWKTWYAGNVFFPWWAVTQIGLVALSMAVYLALSTRALRASSAPFEWAARRDRWLSALLAGFAASAVALVAVDLVAPLVMERSGGAFVSVWVYATVLGLAVGAGLVQADVLARPVPRHTAPAVPAASEALPPELVEAHARALAKLVETEQPHLDPDLTLGSLASQLGLTDKTLSAVLNRTGDGYADFVGGLRVDEARRRLADPAYAALSVLAVGLDAGFASKSTFNRVFKERTGQTPSAYRAAVAHKATEAA